MAALTVAAYFIPAALSGQPSPTVVHFDLEARDGVRLRASAWSCGGVSC